MRLIREYIKEHKLSFIFLVLLTIVSSLISTPVPYISKILIDNANEVENSLTLPFILFLFLSIVFLQIIFSRISIYISARFFKNFIADVRKKVIRGILGIPLTHQKRGDIQVIILSDIELLSSNFSFIIANFFSKITMILAYIIIIFAINVRLALLSLLFLPIYCFWIVSISQRIKSINSDLQISKSNITETLTNVLLNDLVITIYRLSKKIQNKLNKIIDLNSVLFEKNLVYNNFVSIVSSLIITAATFIPLFYGVILVKNNKLDLGSLVALNTYIGLLFTPITSLIQLITVYKTSCIYEERIIPYLPLKNEEKETQKKDFFSIYLTTINLSIFTEKNLVVSNINIKLEPGKTILLTGSNGSGKTLFLKSISGLYSDIEGEIFFNKLGIEELSNSEIYENVIYVSNNQGLILDTLKHDLIGESNTTNEKIESITRLVELTDPIYRLPNKYDTSSEEVSAFFSTGELQKFRLARALLQEPKVLLLDEIFSNIDPISSKRILNNIRQQFPNLSIIIVEHHANLESSYDEKWKIENNQLICCELK